VPAEERGRSEEQASGRQSAAERCQEQAVGRKQLRSLDITAKDGDLVAEGKQLEVALGLRPRADHEDAHQQSHQGIDGREEHEPGT
jgi:hypothetical protein